MVIPPNILSQIEGQPLTADASFGGEPSLEVAPKAFQTVDMVVIRPYILPLAMLDQTMDLSLCGDPGIALPGVRTNHRTSLDPLTNQWQQSLSLDVRHDLCPNFSASTQNAKHGCLWSPSPSFCTLSSDVLPLVLPLPTQISRIN